MIKDTNIFFYFESFGILYTPTRGGENDYRSTIVKSSYLQINISSHPITNNKNMSFIY